MTAALRHLGWNERWQALFEDHAARGLEPARVIRTDRGSALVATEGGVVRAAPAARLLKAAAGAEDLPVVGDWVALLAEEGMEAPLVEAVLERGGAITRGDPGEGSDVQVLAANVDVVFVVHPIAQPPNLRRIERELTMAWDSGAVPVVVLTKADLAEDPDGARAAVETVALGVDVVAVNALAGESVAPLHEHVAGHRTVVLIGPSGAGKSTLANALAGEERQATAEVRAGDQRGRHTTVARELIALPGGGVLIDTPGLRALGLTGSEEGIASTFSDIARLAQDCRFRDCIHVDEPGCAVRAAVESGELPAERLASYQKLLREAAVAAARTDARSRAEDERRSKVANKALREYYRNHPR